MRLFLNDNLNYIRDLSLIGMGFLKRFRNRFRNRVTRRREQTHANHTRSPYEKPLRLERLMSEYSTDESTQYIAHYPHTALFLRVPKKQSLPKMLETFFLRSMLNILYPQNSIPQISMVPVTINAREKPRIGTLSTPVQGLSKDYYLFQDHYYKQAHKRNWRDPSRVAFFQRLSTYEHPHFVRALGDPIAYEIFRDTGLAVDTKGPMNVGNLHGKPIFFEVFRVRQTHKRLKQALQIHGITREKLQTYWMDVPAEYRERLLEMVDKL